MRAVIRDRYGTPDVLRLQEFGRPVPKEDVIEATMCVETEQKTGNAVLTVSGDRGM